jgi:hypothetical protein
VYCNARGSEDWCRFVGQKDDSELAAYRAPLLQSHVVAAGRKGEVTVQCGRDHQKMVLVVVVAAADTEKPVLECIQADCMPRAVALARNSFLDLQDTAHMVCALSKAPGTLREDRGPNTGLET